MAERERFSPPAIGGISLLTVFAVLCLTVFALLGLATVRADERLGEASAKAVSDYYAAECQAQEILALLRAGECPEGVEFSGLGTTYAEYTCPISDTQELQVQVCLLESGEYTILRWQAVPAGERTIDEGLTLWDGGLFF